MAEIKILYFFCKWKIKHLKLKLLEVNSGINTNALNNHTFLRLILSVLDNQKGI